MVSGRDAQSRIVDYYGILFQNLDSNPITKSCHVFLLNPNHFADWKTMLQSSAKHADRKSGKIRIFPVQVLWMDPNLSNPDPNGFESIQIVNGWNPRFGILNAHS